MMSRFVALFTMVSVFCFCQIHSAHSDSRIRTIKYVENRVIDLVGVYGYQISIEFPEGESIENVAVGDSIAWQVTPNKSASTLFVKPVEEGNPTNMTVVTTARRYIFSLSALHPDDAEPSQILFVLQFKAPPVPKSEVSLATPTAFIGPAVPKPNGIDQVFVNKNYTYSGARGIVPAQVFDNGRVTYFRWPVGAATPAIFLLEDGGKESIVNYSFVEEFIVVDRVAPRFILRRGGQQTELFNEGFQPIDPGPDAPKLRAEEEKRSWFSNRGEGK